MDITKIVARNLSAWMKASDTLGTLQKVTAKSGVGFGTIRRARNGDGNITIQNLHDIAKAFGRSAVDLLADSQQTNVVMQESAPYVTRPPAYRQIMALLETSDRDELLIVLGAARTAIDAHRKAHSIQRNAKRRTG